MGGGRDERVCFQSKVRRLKNAINFDIIGLHAFSIPRPFTFFSYVHGWGSGWLSGDAVEFDSSPLFFFLFCDII